MTKPIDYNLDFIKKYMFGDESRKAICSLYTVDDWIVATDAHRAFLVDQNHFGEAVQRRHNNVMHCEAHDDAPRDAIRGFISSIKLYHPLMKPAVVVDFVVPDDAACVYCNGEGTQPKHKMCPECEGSGDVIFSNDHSDYSVQCESCYGAGDVANAEYGHCKHCDGSGKMDELDYAQEHPIEYLGGDINALYLRDVVGDIPDCLVYYDSDSQMYYFTNKDMSLGGVVMGCRI